MKPSGQVISQGGKTAYYVPKNGTFRKIDLTATPPRVVQTGQQVQDSLQPRACAVSDVAGCIVVQVTKSLPGASSLDNSNTVRIYDTGTLMLKKELNLGITNCYSLSASSDGAYAYVLDSARALLSVVDLKQMQEVRVLSAGKMPLLVFPLP
jgi:DNA-binding beta-propeller fold protein YncE